MGQTSQASSRWFPRLRMPALRMPTPVEIAVACELVGLAYSVAANVIGVWSGGAIAVGAAAFLPLFLIGGVYLLLSDRVPKAWHVPHPRLMLGEDGHYSVTWCEGDPGALLWWVNLAAAAALIGPPALASYHHQRTLLLDVGTPAWLAAILPLPVDGLVIRAALTLFRHTHQSTATGASGATEPASGQTSDGAADVNDPLTDVAPVTGPRTDEPETPAAERQGEPAPDAAVARLLAVEGIDAELVDRARTVVGTPVPNRHGKPALPGRQAVADALGVPLHIARHLLALRPEGPLQSVDTGSDQEVSA